MISVILNNKNFRDFVKKILPKSFEKIFFTIKSHLDYRPIYNHYKTNYSKHVLISYVVTPFRRGSNIYHTNSVEALVIADIFNRAGYNVDISWFLSKKKIKYEKYDVIFGIGEPIERSFYQHSKKTKKISYVAGMHPYYNNQASIQRVKEVYDKSGRLLMDSLRLMDQCWTAQFNLSDGIIALGNSSVGETYKKFFKGDVICIPPSYIKTFDYKIVLLNKNFSSARLHFLWFGGSGCIHKGVDLLLDFFKNRSDIYLHICGPIKSEKDFVSFYHDELYKTKNIILHDFVSLDSEQFLHLIRTCAFVIFPSCAEGGGASVVNVMANGGLIPIVSKSSSIDVHSYGIEIPSLDLEGIGAAIDAALALSNGEIMKRSWDCAKFVAEEHSMTLYTSRLERAINKFISVDRDESN